MRIKIIKSLLLCAVPSDKIYIFCNTKGCRKRNWEDGKKYHQKMHGVGSYLDEEVNRRTEAMRLLIAQVLDAHTSRRELWWKRQRPSLAARRIRGTLVIESGLVEKKIQQRVQVWCFPFDVWEEDYPLREFSETSHSTFPTEQCSTNPRGIYW